MPRETVTIEGLAGLKAALASKVEELRAGATMAVAEEVRLIELDARTTAPVDKGDLVAHIDGQASGTSGSIRSTSRHAGFVEHGTYKDKAQPYMKPAADRARRRFPRRAADIIRGALGA